MISLSDHFNLRALRSCLYLLTPAESSFENVSEVPSYTNLITPVFMVLYIAEVIAITILGMAPNEGCAFKDSATNFVITMFNRFCHRLVHMSGVTLVLYVYVYENFRVVDIAWDNYAIWLFCFFAWDFSWYWSHRASHEIAILWSFHRIHHSSEYFNLSVGLRHGVFLDVPVLLVFTIWQALFVPPPIYLVHSQLNAIAQLWTHTALIRNVPILDYILITPSLHRVHHGRNPYCIDTNYGGVLSIWDRLFGTLVEERDSEPVKYGSAMQQLKYYDCIKHQFQIVKYYLINKPLRTPGSILTKLKTIVYPLGWTGETPESKICQSALWKRWIDPRENILPVQGTEDRREKLVYSNELQDIVGVVSSTNAMADRCLAAYAFCQLLLLTPCYFAGPDSAMNGIVRYAYLAHCLATLYAITAAFDQRVRALCVVELCRNLVTLGALMAVDTVHQIFIEYLGREYVTLYELMSGISLLAWVIIGVIILRNNSRLSQHTEDNRD